MATRRPRPVVVDLTDLSSDDDDLPPPQRSRAIDLTTQSPPLSKTPRTGISDAGRQDREQLGATSSTARRPLRKNGTPKSSERYEAPAVKFSPPSPSREYSPNPRSESNSQQTLIPSRASRRTAEVANKSNSKSLPLGAPHPQRVPHSREPDASTLKGAPEPDMPPALLDDVIPSPRPQFEEEDQDEEDDGSDDDNDIEDIYPSRDHHATDVPTLTQSNSDKRSQNDNSSIGSTSPLLTRLKQKKQMQNARYISPGRKSQSTRERMARIANPRYQQDATDLQNRLRGFIQRMKDDTALSTRFILADAREAALERNTLAVDKISPFASMTSVILEPGAQVPAGKIKDVLHHYPVQKSGKFGKGKSILSAKRVSGNTHRVPKYSSHTNVRRNILKPDDEKLKFIPFLGESRNEANFKRLVKELEQVYSPRSSETSREAEENSRIRQYLPMWLEELQLGCDLPTLKHYLLLHNEGGELGMEPRDRRLLLETFGESLSRQTKEAARGFCKAFDEVFDAASQVEDVVLPAGMLKEMIETARAAKVKPSQSPNRIGTYADLSCLICAAIDCPTHGDFVHERVYSSDIEDERKEGQPPEMRYDPKSLNLGFEDTMRRHESCIKEDIEPVPQSRKKYCSDECYMATDFSDLDYEFDEKHLAVLPQMIATYRHPNYRSCYIAYALNIPCWTVWGEIQRYDNEHHEKAELPSLGRARKPEWYDNKKKALKGDLDDFTAAHLHQERGQAVACGHVGPCVVQAGENSCPCATSNILCESFCGCSDDCPRRFTGCSCSSMGLACITDNCICIKMNRECGPECGSCGALARINPANKYDDEMFTTGCQNVYLQRGVSKAMVIGESQLVGFGLYLAEPVKKGDYLSEYSGENISSEEADRRGIVYDRKFLSFLFDLNQDRVIDAARLGNKTRFINHSGSAADGLNCEAKIVLVNGEHRIKFVALRDISSGEELLFNYGKKFAEKQGLTKTLPKAKAGGKRGVLEGEAVDALDGIDQRKKGTREKINAIRGGKDKKGRGSKMRKTAAPMGPVAEEDLYAAQPEDEVEAEDYDEFMRPRRKRFRPTRYTR